MHLLHVAVSALRLDQCLELLIRTNRLPEAAFLARTYLPSQVSRCLRVTHYLTKRLTRHEIAFRFGFQKFCLPF